MISDPALRELVDELCIAKARHIIEMAPEDMEHEVLLAAAFGMGFQTALELAYLDFALAGTTIRVIHESRPEAADENNRNALTFILRSRS